MRAVILIFFSILLYHTDGLTQTKDTPYVILVSFDGFRYDYVEKYDLPNFKSFIKKGAASEGMIPSFPSKTFPNHYTLVTGLYPGHHGLVDNTFYDPKRNEMYTMRIRERATDSYYYGGTPIWQLARQHGLKSGSVFWVGSEITESHPDYYFPYDESMPDTVRVNHVISWLKLPPAERPHFITLYFSSPDHEAHNYGPVSEETRKAVLQSDKILARLMEALQTIPLPVNVVLVSDHGMLEMKDEEKTFIYLDELFISSDSEIKVANGGTQAHLYLKNTDSVNAVYSKLKALEKNFTVYTQRQFPKHWNYVNERAGDLLIVANPGFYIRDKQQKDPKTSASLIKFGAHGYDPKEVKDMRGIFYAQGPNIKESVKIKAFENIHVYPFLARILKLATPAIDGDKRVLESIYRE
jgi:predicted AlkP superfamily pyrophosphatase or phosphodiesterase